MASHFSQLTKTSSDSTTDSGLTSCINGQPLQLTCKCQIDNVSLRVVLREDNILVCNTSVSDHSGLVSNDLLSTLSIFGAKVNSSPRLPNSQNISQEQFMLSIFFPFVKCVDPVKSKLLQLLKVIDLISDEQEDHILGNSSTVKQANSLWSFLYSVPEDVFWEKCAPLLKMQYPKILSESAVQKMPETPLIPVCACHLMENKLSLPYVCCFFLLSKDTVSDELCSFIIEDYDPDKKWAAIFQYFRENYASCPNLQKSLDILLRLFLQSAVTADVQKLLTDSNFTCTCAKNIFCPDLLPRVKRNSSTGHASRGNVTSVAAEIEAEYAAYPSPSVVFDAPPFFHSTNN